MAELVAGASRRSDRNAPPRLAQVRTMRLPLSKPLLLPVGVAAALLLGIWWGATSLYQRKSPRPPNIVLILFDDLGYEGFAAYGDDWAGWTTPVLTPHIDSLAAAGMRFTQHYAASPVCSPTRVSLLTGSYPQRLNIRKQLSLAGAAHGIPSELTSLPEALRARGYRTAHFGKWHVGLDKPEYRPLGLGFDESIVLRTLRYNDPKLQFDDGEIRRVEGHSTDLLTGYAEDFIRRNRDRPFFVNLWLWAPHVPSQAPGGDWSRFSAYSYYREEAGLRPRDAEFAALISNADEKIGELISTLEELDLTDDTIVVVTTDNGGMIRGDIAANASLRGAKGDPFEGGIRVPLVVRWPAHVAPGTVDDTPVMSFDLVPTLAEAAGLDPGELESDGRSLVGLLQQRGRRQLHDRLVWETAPCNALSHEYREAHPEGRWHDFAVRRGPWKLVYQAVVDDPATGVSRCREDPLRGPQWYLFDVERDPRETTNLILEEPARAEALYSDYLDWRSRITLLPFKIEARFGAVEVIDRDLIFAGGCVRLAHTALFDFHDGSFSVTALVLPAQRGRQIIAQRRGSWTLRLAEDGAVELAVVDDDSGRESVLRSAGALPLGEWTRVSFSIFGLKRSPASVRLFVGTQLTAEDNRSLQAVRRSMETVSLGGDPRSDAARFRGSLRDVELRVGSLMTEEVERLEKSALGQPRAR